VYAFERLGLDPKALCASIDVDLEAITDAGSRTPRDVGGRLWRAALEKSGDRFLGLSAADAWEARPDHLVFLLLLSAKTFGEGLTTGVRFQELLSHGRVIEIDEHPTYHAMHINKIEYELPITPHEIEFMAGIFMKLFGYATDGRFRATEVHFQHPYRGNIQKYARLFRGPVFFGRPRNTLLIDDASWNLPLSHGNPLLHAQLRDMAANVHADLQDHTFVDSVRGRIRGLLPTGNFGIESVANALYTTPRTLQRRLREEETTFRALVDAVRKSIVLDCVERRQAPDEIIRHAGYTNPRSFRRALKRWHL